LFAAVPAVASPAQEGPASPAPADRSTANTADTSSDRTSSASDLASVPGEATTQADGCSIVEWCDKPGSDGTICRQRGCDVDSAINECIDEAWRICGTPTCPWTFIASNGTRTSLCF
jgi:hypothetical protein